MEGKGAFTGGEEQRKGPIEAPPPIQRAQGTSSAVRSPCLTLQRSRELLGVSWNPGLSVPNSLPAPHFIFRTDVSLPPQHHLISQSAHNALQKNFHRSRVRAVPGTALMFLFTFSHCIPPNSPQSKLIVSPFHRVGNWGSNRLNNLPTDTQLQSSWSGLARI